MKWWRRWRKRHRCFHHDHGGNPANSRPAVSWIEQRIIDDGMRKLFWCKECGKAWVT